MPMACISNKAQSRVSVTQLPYPSPHPKDQFMVLTPISLSLVAGKQFFTSKSKSNQADAVWESLQVASYGRM